MSILPTEEDDTRNTVLFHIFVRLRRSLTDMLNVFGDRFDREFIKRVRLFRQGSCFLAGLNSKSVEVKVHRLIRHVPSYGEDAIWLRKDFAGLRGPKPIAIGGQISNEQTVRSYDHLIVFLIDNNESRRSEGGAWMNLNQCYQTPKYLRTNDQSFKAFGPPAVDYIANHDIDVRYDGR